MIDWLNQNQGFATTVLTMVYVAATTAVCFFNYKTVNEMNKQTNEITRQFNETNRPYVTVTVEIVDQLASLCIQNLGKKAAQNIKIKIDDEFMSNPFEHDNDKLLESLQSSCFNLAIGQKLLTGWFRNYDIQNLTFPKMAIHLEYRDEQKTYEDCLELDLAQYMWVMSPSDKVTLLKRQNEILKQIAENTKKA